MTSAIWHYGFGRSEAEIEAKKRARARGRVYREVKPSIVELVDFKVESLRSTVTVKNVDSQPATIMSVNCWKVLKQLKIESRFFGEKIKVREKIDKGTQPETFTVFPRETLTFTMCLIEPLEIGRDYVLELRMGEHTEPHPEIEEAEIVYKLGWIYLLNFNGKEVKRIAVMELAQAWAFWRKVKKNAEAWLENFPRKGRKLLLINSILGLPSWLILIFAFPSIPLILAGFIGWILILDGWRKASKGKSALRVGVIGGALMLDTILGFIPGVLAMIGAVLSKRSPWTNKHTHANQTKKEICIVRGVKGMGKQHLSDSDSACWWCG